MATATAADSSSLRAMTPELFRVAAREQDHSVLPDIDLPIQLPEIGGVDIRHDDAGEGVVVVGQPTADGEVRPPTRALTRQRDVQNAAGIVQMMLEIMPIDARTCGAVGATRVLHDGAVAVEKADGEHLRRAAQ